MSNETQEEKPQSKASYAAIVVSPEGQQVITRWLEELENSALPGFTPMATVEDAHLTVGLIREGCFSSEVMTEFANTPPFNVDSQMAPLGDSGVESSIKIVYGALTGQLLVTVQMDSQEFSGLRDMIAENTGFKRIPHLTIGEIDPDVLGVDIDEIKSMIAEDTGNFPKVQAKLDKATATYLQSAGATLAKLGQEPVPLSISHVHAEPFNSNGVSADHKPMSQRDNYCDAYKKTPVSIDVGQQPITAADIAQSEEVPIPGIHQDGKGCWLDEDISKQLENMDITFPDGHPMSAISYDGGVFTIGDGADREGASTSFRDRLATEKNQSTQISK